MKKIVGLLLSLTFAVILSQGAGASGFNPGRIIDDEIFYDSRAMGSAAAVQRFIEQHTPACDTWGTGPSGHGNTKAQYAAQRGWHGPPYVCLQNYHENPNNGETSFDRGGGAFPGGINAGQIIWDAAQRYQINPQVLLVTLRKEPAGPLFADSWPLRSQYKYAMGYGCPDSGPGYSANCDNEKAGFYKQVNKAAWQLRKYRNEIQNYNYQPGRVNRILYNPNPACGYRDVYIENYATASLYIYTPYVPNDAALAAYPGTAHCGAYGNRNFFYMFREWFGSTHVNSTLLRSHDNATVYLVSDNVKYPVPNYDILAALSPLGGVGFVSQAYLDKIPTGQVANRLMRSPDGTVYFYDSGIRLAFTTCAMVAQYGMDCGNSMLLTEAQVGHGYKTTSGKRFYIQNGTRREVLDDKSLALQQYDQGYNVLGESAIQYLPYGTPIVREAAVVRNRDTGYQKLISNGTLHNIRHSEYVDQTLQSLGGGVLQQESINKLPQTSQTVDDYVKNPAGETFLITNQGKKKVTKPQDIPVSPLALSDETVRSLPGSGALDDVVTLKSSDNGTVYVMESRQKRPIVAMEDVFAITKTERPTIAWLSGETIRKIPSGNVVFAPGKMVKAPSNGTVYVSDGYDTLIPLSHFDQAADLGVNGAIRQVDDRVVEKYKVSNRVLSPYVSCEGRSYLGMGGTLYELHLPSQNPYPLQSKTCAMLTKEAKLPQFVGDPGGTIYHLKNGTLHPIRSWQKFVELNKEKLPIVKISYITVSLLAKGELI